MTEREKFRMTNLQEVIFYLEDKERKRVEAAMAELREERKLRHLAAGGL